MAVNAVTPTTAPTGAPAQDGDPKKFDQALANARSQLIDPNQLAQMGTTVMSPMIMSQVQDIIGDALADDD